MQSWLDKPLADIVKSITDNPRLSVKIDPKFTSPIEYESQYLETNFEFLQRIAKHYNEWLLYDGDTLFFGEPEKGDAIPIVHGVDIDEIDIGIQTHGKKFQSFSYDSMGDKMITSTSPDAPSGLNELGQFAFNASLETFTQVGSELPLTRVKSKADLDDYVKRKQQSAFTTSNYISGKSVKRELTVGSIIDIESSIFNSKAQFDNKKHGKYIIIEITHYGRVGNHYYNTFVALPASIKVLPEPQVQMPTAHTQMATVISNDDPKKKGRVQVKMNWQTGDMKTSWIRVMTPDGGNGSKGGNRGLVFIPEKGDNVLVGFRYDNPNRPFIMGSLFNGNTGSGGGDQNKTKSITTRSGSTITFDDDKGNISISDAKNCSVSLDGSGNISISSGSSINLSTGDSSINLEKDGTITISGKNISVIGDGGSISNKAKEVSINGDDQVSVDSTTVNVTGKKETTISGQAKATVTSSGITALEGTIVKLN